MHIENYSTHIHITSKWGNIYITAQHRSPFLGDLFFTQHFRSNILPRRFSLKYIFRFSMEEIPTWMKKIPLKLDLRFDEETISSKLKPQMWENQTNLFVLISKFFLIFYISSIFSHLFHFCFQFVRFAFKKEIQSNEPLIIFPNDRVWKSTHRTFHSFIWAIRQFVVRHCTSSENQRSLYKLLEMTKKRFE